jgi:hypothetical protein
LLLGCEGKLCNIFKFLTGLQVWQDGGQYEGEFLNDMRHGEGELKWSNEEVPDMLLNACVVILLYFTFKT